MAQRFSGPRLLTPTIAMRIMRRLPFMQSLDVFAKGQSWEDPASKAKVASEEAAEEETVVAMRAEANNQVVQTEPYAPRSAPCKDLGSEGTTPKCGSTKLGA